MEQQITEENVNDVLYSLAQSIKRQAESTGSRKLLGIAAILVTVSAGDRLFDIVKYCRSVSSEELKKINNLLEILYNKGEDKEN